MEDKELIKRLCIINDGCMAHCKHSYYWEGTCGTMQSCDFDDICYKENNYAEFELNREQLEKELEGY